MKVFNEENFEKEVLQADKPVLIDLWAPWCGPCKALEPAVEAIKNKYQDKIIVGKLNVDENPLIASNYGVMSIPTLLFFKDGKILEQIIGLVSMAKIEKKISPYI
jgi:thioredoxin 1